MKKYNIPLQAFLLFFIAYHSGMAVEAINSWLFLIPLCIGSLIYYILFYKWFDKRG